MSHTPGPWEIAANRITSRTAKCMVLRLPALTDAYGDEPPEQIERWNADARLIAAAPELLKALEIVEPIIDDVTESVEPGRMIRAAIAKARGEE